MEECFLVVYRALGALMCLLIKGNYNYLISFYGDVMVFDIDVKQHVAGLIIGWMTMPFGTQSVLHSSGCGIGVPIQSWGLKKGFLSLDCYMVMLMCLVTGSLVLVLHF